MITDSQGAYRITAPEGSVRLIAKAKAYAAQELRANAPSETDFELTPGATIVGRVLSTQSKAPLEGMHVDAESTDQSLWAGGCTISDQDGRFAIDGLPPGRYRLSAEGPHFAGAARESLSVGVLERSPEAVIEMMPAIAVRGRVLVGEASVPCAEGSVALEEHAADSLPAIRTARASIQVGGAVELDPVLPGLYIVRVRCDGAIERNEAKLKVKDADLDGLEWRVEPGFEIKGTVVDNFGRALEGKWVRVEKKGTVASAETGHIGTGSGADGEFRLDGLSAGTYVVSAARTAAGSATVTVGLDAHPVPLSLVIDRPGRITGCVSDERGAPIAGIGVAYCEADKNAGPGSCGGFASAMTDRHGRFALEDLRPGKYRIAIADAMEEVSGVQVTASGRTSDGILEIALGATVEIEVTVRNLHGEIRGRVVEPNGSPLPDAKVIAVRERSDPSQRLELQWVRYSIERLRNVRTEADGSFRLTGLQEGRYLVLAQREGRGEAFKRDIQTGSEVTITIEPEVSISGTVLLPGGGVASSFLLLMSNDSGYRLEERFSGTNGVWAVRELTAGQYEIEARADVGAAHRSVKLAPGARLEGIVLQLEPLVTVRGQVVEIADGRPIPGVVLNPLPWDSAAGYLGPRSVTTDVAGHFRIEKIPPGEFSLLISSDWALQNGYAHIFPAFTAKPGFENELPPIRLIRAARRDRRPAGTFGFSVPLTEAQ